MSCLTCRPQMVFATVAVWHLVLASASMNHADEDGQNHVPHRMFVLQIKGDSSPMSRSSSSCVSDCESNSPVVAFSALLLLVVSVVGMAIIKKRNKKMPQSSSYNLPPTWWNKRNFVELKDDNCNVDPPATNNSNARAPKQGKVLPIQLRSNTFTMDEKHLSDPVHSMDSLVGSDPEDNDDDEDTVAVSNVYRAASKHAFGEHLNFLRRQIILPTTPAKTVAPAPNPVHENIRFKGTLVEV